MVYVPPPSNYDEAIKYALSVFPEQLSHVSKERLTFNVNVKIKGIPSTVRISKMSWGEVMAGLTTYEVVELFVLPLARDQRFAKSESDMHDMKDSGSDVERCRSENPDLPPRYQTSSNPGDEERLGFDLRERRSPPMKRSASATGWLKKTFSSNP